MSRRDFAVGVAIGAVVTAAAFGAAWALSGTDDAVPEDAAALTGTQPPPGTSTATDMETDQTEPARPSEPVRSEPAVTGGGSPATTPELPPALPVECPAATVTVATADELQEALDAARPGSHIALADGTYVGNFVATADGSEDQPIFLCGGPGAVLDGDSITGGYVLHLDGVAYWRVVGFTVRNGQKGVIADSTSYSLIQGLTVTDIGDEAIHLRSASTHNVVLANTIRRTGLRRDKFGEGVYVGSATSNWERYSGGGPDRSDFNVVRGNDIAETGSESIDIKEGTTGGQVIGNTMDGSGMTGADSLIDVKGNDWLIEGNVGVHAEEAIQTHRIEDGWGTRNVFRNNTIDVDGDGVHIYIHDPRDTANVVECNNRTASGAAARSNVECVG